MTSTNRALNRIFLIVVGAALLAAGLLAVAVAVSPEWARLWRSTAPSIGERAERARAIGLAAAGIPQLSWPLLAVPLGAAILIAALLVFVFAQGRGRTPHAVEALPIEEETAAGTLTVDAAVAHEVIARSLASVRGMPRVGVAAYRVKGRPALRITVTPARGGDPVAAVAQIERAVLAWDEFLGRRVPVLIHVNAGMRTVLSTVPRTAESFRASGGEQETR